MYYLNIFYINSIIGFILETAISLIFKLGGNSGILFGPWTPVYGIGSIIITLAYLLLTKKIKNNKTKFVMLFLIMSIFLSFIEAIGGIFIERIFHEEFWNYESHLLNIGKYASIEMSLVWGLASIVYILFIMKYINKIEKHISKSITYILTILFVIDNIATIIIKLK